MDAPAEFEIEVSDRSSDGIELRAVELRGDVDLAHADEVTQTLLSEDCRRAGGVLLDLTGVEFMDSSGLRSVLVAVEQLECPLVAVVAPGSPVARLLELTEVGDRVPSHPDESAAIAALTESA